MANPFWLSNHLDLHHCYLVVPLDDGQETALYTGLTNHVPNAREVSDVPIVEWGGYDLRASGAYCASSASNGAASASSERTRNSLMGMPYEHHERLHGALPDLRARRRYGPFQRLRLVKSEEEIGWPGARRRSRTTRSSPSLARPCPG